MIKEIYRNQVDLLLRVLPHVAKEELFALKGGTAINFFVRDLPRLSVDIDLTYLPIDSREEALKNIQDGLARIKNDIEKYQKDINVTPVPLGGGSDAKLNCQCNNAQIKIEVNTVTRGIVFETQEMSVVEKVQDEFDKFAEIRVVSLAELYGGKICAALDRQHPRDLFDVKLLLENEGLNDMIWQGFKVGLISHNRPIYELIFPKLKDQQKAFETQFAGMATFDFSYQDYENTRNKLINIIKEKLNKEEKEFFLSFEMGKPKWDLFPIEVLKDLPAVNWKLLNTEKLINENKTKHSMIIEKFRKEIGFNN